MEVLSISPTPHDGRPGVREIAKFDLQVTPDVRLHGCKLRQTPDGKRFSYGPAARGNRAASFTHDFAVRVTQEAAHAYDNFIHAV